jgi:16S rRNA (guanine527-N7)-methyltransferase
VTAVAATDDRDDPAIAAGIVAAFGDRRDLATRYADLLLTDGVIRGVIGPREGPRLWQRHLLNSVVLSELIKPAARVVDLGSGAGLPGIPLAIARPDLDVILLEPLQRRVIFLEACVQGLDLTNVTVHRGRAEEGLKPPGEYVVARAVAPLDKLVTLCQKILIDNGVLLALKGATASGEVDQVRRTMKIDAELLTLAAPGHSASVVRAVLPTSGASAGHARRDTRRGNR